MAEKQIGIGLNDAELMALPMRVPMLDAGLAFGYGRRKTYELAKAGKFDVTLHRDGVHRYALKVDIFHVLGMRLDGTSVHEPPRALAG